MRESKRIVLQLDTAREEDVSGQRAGVLGTSSLVFDQHKGIERHLH